MVQSFSQVHGKQRYFIVADDEDKTVRPQPTESMPSAEQADVDEIMDEFDLLEADHKKALERLDEEIANTDKSGWWNKTGWADHLKESNLQHLSRAARLPAKDEVTLRKVMNLVEACIEQSVKGLMILPAELRRWLKSSQIAEVDRRPMGRLAERVQPGHLCQLLCETDLLLSAGSSE